MPYSSTVPLAPKNVTAVQDSPTNILLSWSTSNNATGYRIHYHHDNGSNISTESVSGGSTHNHTLTGLQNGEIYTISILALSGLFYSDNVTVNIISLGSYKPVKKKVFFIIAIF